MTAKPQKVRLKFRCDQDFDKMAVGANGKPFCEMCQKSLVDFRTKSLKEVVNYTKEKSGCGVFNAGQVETDMICQVSFASFRKYFLAIGTFLFAEIGYSQTKEDSTKQNLEIVDTVKSNKIGETKEGEKSSENSTEASCANEKSTSKMKRYDYGLFFRKKFPFISFRRHRYYGGSFFW